MRLSDLKECNYNLSENCEKTLKPDQGIKHVVYAKPTDYPKRPLVKWACLPCEMFFDDD